MTELIQSSDDAPLVSEKKSPFPGLGPPPSRSLGTSFQLARQFWHERLPPPPITSSSTGANSSSSSNSSSSNTANNNSSKICWSGSDAYERNEQRRQCAFVLSLLAKEDRLQLEKEYGDATEAWLTLELVPLSFVGHFYLYVRAFMALTTFTHGLSVFALITFVLGLANPLLRKIGVSENLMPHFYASWWTADFVRGLIGVEVVVHGRENLRNAVGTRKRVLGLYSHASNLDPFVVKSSTSPTHFFTWVYKHDLQYIPGIGLFMMCAGNVPINRKMHEKAVKALRSASERPAPPMVAPEGTRSKTGQIAKELKKGVFHTQKEQSGLFAPLILVGGFDLWSPKAYMPTMGRVHVLMLPAIDAAKEEDMEVTREKVRLAMAEGLAVSVPRSSWKLSVRFLFAHFFYYVPLWAASQYATYFIVTIAFAFVRGLLGFAA